MNYWVLGFIIIIIIAGVFATSNSSAFKIFNNYIGNDCENLKNKQNIEDCKAFKSGKTYKGSYYGNIIIITLAVLVIGFMMYKYFGDRKGFNKIMGDCDSGNGDKKKDKNNNGNSSYDKLTSTLIPTGLVEHKPEKVSST